MVEVGEGEGGGGGGGAVGIEAVVGTGQLGFGSADLVFGVAEEVGATVGGGGGFGACGGAGVVLGVTGLGGLVAVGRDAAIVEGFARACGEVAFEARGVIVPAVGVTGALDAGAGLRAEAACEAGVLIFGEKGTGGGELGRRCALVGDGAADIGAGVADEVVLGAAVVG